MRYIEHFDWDNRLIIIVMEFVPGGDLGKFIGSRGILSEETTKIMAEQLLHALDYLHQKNITHRDVKPDNILIQSQQPFVVKLTDFGLSKMVDNDQTFLRTFCGTLLYCAPEVYSEYRDYDEHGRRNIRYRQRRPPPGQRYNHAVDIWSLGGVLFYALTGRPPYSFRTGISYSELLHMIMTQKLDTSPLERANVSPDGFDFLRQMLQKRPENRATAQDLLAHPWLGGTGIVGSIASSQSYDDVSEEDLGRETSQLNIRDSPQGQLAPSDDEIIDDEDDIPFSGYDSEKENRRGGQAAAPRLFGEVNVSAIGSSGVIPEHRLNLPVSERSLGETDIPGSEVEDSFASENHTTPTQQKSPNQSSGGARLSSDKSQTVDELNNLTFDVSSQSLGGAESILEHLNMKSVLTNLHRSRGDFTSSKRKPPSLDKSDESDGALVVDKPSIKRLKSEGQLDSQPESENEVDEYSLYLLVPPISRIQSGRQVDSPVHKASYWTAGDSSTWHLRYPEMTQLQYDAFDLAAQGRGEQFQPGKSVLWDFAMKHFPPADVSSLSRYGSFRGHARAVEGSDSLPEALPPESQYETAEFTEMPQKRPVAGLQSTSRSVVGGISVFVTESVTSWGRASVNTRVYTDGMEARVPKFAVKILLWREGFDPSKDLRPWNRPSTTDADSYFFYISTKARNGIVVSDTLVPSHDHKAPSSPSWNWVRLHDGDSIVIWRQDNKSEKLLEVTFRCTWGGSSRPRSGSANTPPALVSEGVAKELDAMCLKAEKRIAQRTEQEFKMVEANQDVVERNKNIDRERERSLAFEARRQEAQRIVSLRSGGHSRATTPVSQGLVSQISGPAFFLGNRTVPTFRHLSPVKHA